jgi:hypothetical protein
VVFCYSSRVAGARQMPKAQALSRQMGQDERRQNQQRRPMRNGREVRGELSVSWGPREDSILRRMEKDHIKHWQELKSWPQDWAAQRSQVTYFGGWQSTSLVREGPDGTWDSSQCSPYCQAFPSSPSSQIHLISQKPGARAPPARLPKPTLAPEITATSG